jgi:hypothetical protein
LSQDLIPQVGFAALLGAALLACSACTVPIAPGFAVQRQAVDLRYSGGAAERAHIRATYRLQNAGNQELRALEVVLPTAQDLQVRTDGRAVAPQTSKAAVRGPAVVSIPFEPPWPRKAYRTVELEYDIALPLTPDDPARLIYLPQVSEWFPELKKPRGMMAQGASRGEEVRLSLSVPQGYLVLTSGKNMGAKTSQGEIEYRYRLRDTDFDPFLLAGRFHQSEIRAAAATVVFWTIDPLAGNAAQKAAVGIAATLRAYEAAFGPRDNKASPIWIVEAATLPSAAVAQEPAGAALPNIVLLNRAAFAESVDSSAFLDRVAEQLARTWFGGLAIPRRSLLADRNLGESLVRFATIVADRARGGDEERQRRAALLVGQFDTLRRQATDKTLLSADSADLPAQREMAIVKGAMFLLALEDAYGAEHVRRALAHIVESLRGQDFGLAVLRAAIEQEAHKELGDFFRAWLDHTGVPADFRARYSGGKGSGN